jgi:hypothetical protein
MAFVRVRSFSDQVINGVDSELLGVVPGHLQLSGENPQRVYFYLRLTAKELRFGRIDAEFPLIGMLDIARE